MPTLGWGDASRRVTRRPQFAVGRLGQPEAVCAEEGVEQAGKPAHDSDESNFVRFAVGGEALVAGLGGRLVADRGHGGHVEQVAGLGAATTDGAAAAVLAGVAVEGGEAEEGGGLAAAEAAEFGHGGAEGGGVDGAEAWDRLDDGVATGEFGVGSDAVAHAAVAGSDVGLEGFGDGAEAAGGLGVELGGELAEGAELLEELAAEGEQVIEQLEVVRLGGGVASRPSRRPKRASMAASTRSFLASLPMASAKRRERKGLTRTVSRPASARHW